MWQLAESIAALGEACEALGIPVTGGNVSLYNETRVGAAAGDPPSHLADAGHRRARLLEDAQDAVGLAFEDEGDLVFLIGAPTAPGLAGSELQQHLDAPLGGVLAPVDLEIEANLGEVLSEAAREGLLHSAHDVGGGGLLANLAESAVAGDVGVSIVGIDDADPVQWLFSESPGRVVVTVPSHHVLAFAQLCEDAAVPLRDIGTVGGDRLEIVGLLDLDLEDVRSAYDGGLDRVLESPA
jgi:phosphoribosylformylglycinamidine synthase subunit PurL